MKAAPSAVTRRSLGDPGGQYHSMKKIRWRDRIHRVCMVYPHRQGVRVTTSYGKRALIHIVFSSLACHTMC